MKSTKRFKFGRFTLAYLRLGTIGKFGFFRSPVHRGTWFVDCWRFCLLHDGSPDYAKTHN